MDIYVVTDPKSTYSAPTNYCFAIKDNADSSGKSVPILFCAPDIRTRNRWLTALRCFKYGSRLQQNFYEAKRREVDMVNREEQIEAQLHNHSNESVRGTRVAMDFTGSDGRVVADPREADSVEVEEAHAWRHKFSAGRPGLAAPRHCSPAPGLRHQGTPPATPPRGGATCAHDTVGGAQGISDGVHRAHAWFHSGVTRLEAVQLISEQGLVDGVFLVRESHSVPGSYVLSLAHDYKVKHCQIHKVDFEGSVYFSLDNGRTKFLDLVQLIEFYTLNAAGLPTRLTHHVSRLLK